MSLEAVAWALKQRVGDPIAKLVLIGLANHHNESSGLCCPRRALLAVAADCDERTIVRKVKWLIAERWITVEQRFEKGRQTTNAYRLVRAESLGCQAVTLPPETAEKVGGHTVTLPSNGQRGGRHSSVTHGGDTAVTPITVIGTKEKKARARPASDDAPCVDRRVEICSAMKGLAQSLRANGIGKGGR